MRLSHTGVRPATHADLGALPAIEAAADDLFAELFGPDPWGRPPSGPQRAASGLVFVMGQPAVGFAHVVAFGDRHWHLEQLSVDPRAGRRGIGRALLHAAAGTALDAGATRLTLRTFADVPWNGAWYRREGFAETTDPALTALVDAESRDGLHRLGHRITLELRLLDEPTPRPAVSVIPLREGPAGLEVYVQHRVATMDAFAGVVVFPGGRVEAGDATPLDLPTTLLAAHADRWGATPFVAASADPLVAARTLLATGVREVAEETGARIDPARLVPWDNWVTPIGLPRRFDVSFFLLPDEGDSLGHTTTEASASEWMPVDELVARTEAGALAMVPPTRTLVDELQQLGSLDAALARRPAIAPVRHDVVNAPRPRRSA